MVSFRSMLASEAPDLKGKPLCQELVDIDNTEYQQISSEETHLRGIEKSDWRLRSRKVALTCLAITVPGYMAVEMLHINSNLVWIAFAASMTSLAGFGLAYMPNSTYSNAIQSIYESRLLRLKGKQRDLSSRISMLESESATQLSCAIDYFNLKYNFYLAKKTNVILLKHQHAN